MAPRRRYTHDGKEILRAGEKSLALLEQKIAALRGTLDTIVTYPQLHFFVSAQTLLLLLVMSCMDLL